jgi:tetratricopeptide (TPR) repeat protein
VDLFDLGRGGLATEIARSQLIPKPVVLNLVNKLGAVTAEDVFFDSRPEFQELMKLLIAQEYRGIDDLFLRKAEAFKTERNAHRLRVNAALQVDADTYARAVQEMEKCFPGEPSLLLLKLDSALVRRDLKATLEAIDALEARLKADPYLDAIRANAHLVAGDPARARTSAEKAIAAEPDLGDGWWLLVSACLAQKDFKAVADALAGIEKNLKIKIEALEDASEYAEFVKSKEYADWLKARRTPASGGER